MGIDLQHAMHSQQMREHFFVQLSAGIFTALCQQDFARAWKDLEEEKSIHRNSMNDGPEPNQVQLNAPGMASAAMAYARAFMGILEGGPQQQQQQRSPITD